MARRSIGPSAWIIGGAGLIIGAVSSGLIRAGNPGNMGLCIACFIRDSAGAFGGAGAKMGGVAYLRPEILGLILGAAVTALVTREFRARGGSSFLLRFVLGFVFMASALVFLGCTVRAWLRLGGGDLNAAVGIAGLVAGIGIGTVFLRAGFNLGRAQKLSKPLGWIGPVVALLLVALAAAATLGAKPSFITITPANARPTAQGAVVQGDKVLKPAGAKLVEGAVVGPDGSVISPKEAVAQSKPFPGGKRAPFVLSLVAGLLLGAVAQRSRFCSMGGIRDAILIRRFDLLFGVFGLVIGALVVNLALGQFKLGFAGQPIAHTDALGNFAAMMVAGLSAVMLGGCPFRQVIMTGEGDVDAAGAVLGMFAGALFAHVFSVASTPKGLSPGGWPALGVMAIVLIAIWLWKRDRAAAPPPTP